MASKQKKQEDFVRVAERRMIKAIKAIHGVANVANRNVYDYTDEQVRQIVDVLTTELDNLRTKFASGNGKKEVDFKFDA